MEALLRETCLRTIVLCSQLLSLLSGGLGFIVPALSTGSSGGATPPPPSSSLLVLAKLRGAIRQLARRETVTGTRALVSAHRRARALQLAAPRQRFRVCSAWPSGQSAQHRGGRGESKNPSPLVVCFTSQGERNSLTFAVRVPSVSPSRTSHCWQRGGRGGACRSPRFREANAEPHGLRWREVVLVGPQLY